RRIARSSSPLQSRRVISSRGTKKTGRKHKDVARRSRNQSPHPALRATFSQREKDTPAECPSPSGRGCREAAGEGSKNFVEKTRSNILVTQRHQERPHQRIVLLRPLLVSLCLCVFVFLPLMEWNRRRRRIPRKLSVRR